MTIKIKGCVLAAAVASLLPVVVSAESVELFKATPITYSGFGGADFDKRFVFAESEVTVYCVDGGGLASVTDDLGGPPIVDNFMTVGANDLASICQGGSAIQPKLVQGVTGTHCFDSGNSNQSVWGQDIRKHFPFDGTASVSLNEGKNVLLFKLWDYGSVYGNSPLDLTLPTNCATLQIIDVNVHPNSDPNPVNTGSGGSTPVAIFGSANLDVYDIDTSTLKLGDAEVKVVGKKSNELCSYEDIGSYDEAYFDNLNPMLDGKYDLLCKFDTYDIFGEAVSGEDVTIKITGYFNSGLPFEGSDVIKIVK